MRNRLSFPCTNLNLMSHVDELRLPLGLKANIKRVFFWSASIFNRLYRLIHLVHSKFRRPQPSAPKAGKLRKYSRSDEFLNNLSNRV